MFNNVCCTLIWESKVNHDIIGLNDRHKFTKITVAKTLIVKWDKCLILNTTLLQFSKEGGTVIPWLSVIYAFLVPSKIVGIPQVGSKMMMLTIEAAKLPFWGARGRRQRGQSIFKRAIHKVLWRIITENSF